MNSCENCIENRPRIGRLAGVTRTLRLAIYKGEGVPTGTPQDLTGNDVVVRVLRDGTEDIYLPGFVVEGDDHNVIKFEWPAAEQAVGNYTIDVTVKDGSGNVNRVNWHGPTGIRLVEYSYQVYGDDATGEASSESVGLIGYYTTSGVGMSAYDEWLSSPESDGWPQTVSGFLAYLKQPATEAAAALGQVVSEKMAEVDETMVEVQEQADADHTRAESDHTIATGDHTRADADHVQAVTDSQQAATDHQRAEIDAAAAASDREKAATDRTKAANDRQQAAADQATAAQDHATASSDHQQAQSDHSIASADHTQAMQDAERAASDHTMAGDDHDTAVSDHQQAEADHTRAEADHTTAAADHTTAAADHTQATADHAVMAGYDTRLGNVEGEVSQLGQRVDKLENDAIGAGIVLENNLINEFQKAKALGWGGGAADSVPEITEDVYGQPNIRYKIQYDNTQKVVHIKFKFRLTAPLAYVTASTNQNIMFVGGAASYRLALRQQASLYNTDNGVLNRRQFLVVQRGTAVANTTLGDPTGAQDLVGEVAYTLRYKGEDYNTVKNYKINLSSSEVSVKDGDTILESFSVDTDELVESVIERINTNSQYLIAKPYAVSGVKFSDCLQINNLPLSFTTYARTWVVRNLIDNRWHDVEVVIDYDKMQSWTNLDGYTLSSVIGTPSTNNIILGGMVSSSVGMMPIQFKDFRLSYSYDDAEIITYPANVSGTITRLISNDSPYLIIFEGHGMEDGVDTKGTVNNMNVTTDRLRRVFEHARLKGFVPVSWQQVIDWKLNGASLPKRCYTLMFDDFRIENYMRLAYRLPFVQFGVKPGLAIITGQNGETRSRNEQVTIDGQTWTLGECFDAIIKGGWYPSSHTISHTLISSIPYTGFFDTLKSFIYSCDKLGIYDDILVYPEGSINQGQLELMPLSGFKLGISVANDKYACRAASSYRLIRHEIGTRQALSDVLAKMV